MFVYVYVCVCVCMCVCACVRVCVCVPVFHTFIEYKRSIPCVIKSISLKQNYLVFLNYHCPRSPLHLFPLTTVRWIEKIMRKRVMMMMMMVMMW